MSLVSNTNFNVTDAGVTSETLTETVMPAVDFGTGGKGQLWHPSLGNYFYLNTPDETVGIDGTIENGPDWLHQKTLSGGLDTRWTAKLRDGHVIERWINGDVGMLLEQFRFMRLLFRNPPDPEASSYIQWSPTYSTASAWNVIIVDVRCGGGPGVVLDRKLMTFGSGYVPPPVELEMRIVSLIP